MYPGLEVIKVEFILRLKIKRNDWLLADPCLVYSESETALKFYNLWARPLDNSGYIIIFFIPEQKQCCGYSLKNYINGTP